MRNDEVNILVTRFADKKLLRSIVTNIAVITDQHLLKT